MTVTVDPLTYTVSEAAVALQVSTRQVYTLVRSGRLPAVPYVHPIRISRQVVKQIVDGERVA